MVPKVVYVLISRTYAYATLHGKMDFAYGINLRIVRWRVCLDYPGGSNGNKKVLKSRDPVEKREHSCTVGGNVN